MYVNIRLVGFFVSYIVCLHLPLSYLQPALKQLSVEISCDEAGIRLITALFISYLIAILYLSTYQTLSSLLVTDKWKHLYFLISGLYLLYYNNGYESLHIISSAAFCYCVLKYVGRNMYSIVINVTVPMVHLLYGYYITQKDEYAYGWTIPHCVLTLRLLAITIDYFDGAKFEGIEDKEEKTQLDTKYPNHVKLLPSLLEFCAFCFFPPTVLVGPQFEYKKYKQFVQRNSGYNCTLSECAPYAFKKFVYGSIYLAVFQFGTMLMPLQYISSPLFFMNDFWTKFTILALTMKLQTCKYISIWLYAEGSCIMFGFVRKISAKNDENDNENDDSDAQKRPVEYKFLSNVDITSYETATRFNDIIRSFNISTNILVSRYIFRRFEWKPLKMLRHFLTLSYLALWHGLQTGYYVTFLQEFLIMNMEWDVLALVSKYRKRYQLLDRILEDQFNKAAIKLLFRVYTIYMFGYAFAPFVLLSYGKWLPVLQSLSYIGHYVYIGWLFVSPVIHWITDRHLNAV